MIFYKKHFLKSGKTFEMEKMSPLMPYIMCAISTLTPVLVYVEGNNLTLQFLAQHPQVSFSLVSFFFLIVSDSYTVQL